MGKISDTYLAYQFIKRLTLPFEQWEAFKLGVIDEHGTALIKRSHLTREQLEHWGRFDVLVANLKRLLAKMPNGHTRIATIAATVLLLKEHNNPSEGELDVDILAEQLDDHIVADRVYEDMDKNLLEGFSKIRDRTSIEEDAAVNCAGGGAVAAIGVGPNGEPGMGKGAHAKYKRKNKTLPNTSLFTRKSIG